jgi:hypothetical protein
MPTITSIHENLLFRIIFKDIPCGVMEQAYAEKLPFILFINYSKLMIFTHVGAHPEGHVLV